MGDRLEDLWLRLFDDSEFVAHINSVGRANQALVAAAAGVVATVDGKPETGVANAEVGLANAAEANAVVAHGAPAAIAEGLAPDLTQVVAPGVASTILSSVGSLKSSGTADSMELDDGLDSILINLPQPVEHIPSASPSASLSFEVPCNQLAAMDTDDDEVAANMDACDLGETGSSSGFLHRATGALAASNPAALHRKDVGKQKHDSRGSEELDNSSHDSAIRKKDVPSNFLCIEALADNINTDHAEGQEQPYPVDLSEEDEGFGIVGSQHQFGDFETYFENKHRKQQLADQRLLQWEKKRRRDNGDSSQLAAIFQGCSIHVNGYTEPSIAAIHRMVVFHGGVFIQYLKSKSAATHIVCDHLTPRKRMEFRNCRVVRARWVADCVEKQLLLDWREYRLIDDVVHDQQRLGFPTIDTSSTRDSPGFLELLDDEGGLEDGLEYGREENSLKDIDSPENGLQGNTETVPTTEDPKNVSDASASPARLHPVFGQMDAKHPEFLAHFFANSRLHRLSTWKNDLRAQFARLVANGLHARAASPGVRRVVLHIDFDCFFATMSAQRHAHVDIERDPVAVSHGGNTSDIASCNYVARSAGVRNGMWLGYAKRLCPALKVIGYDFDAYERASRALYTYLVSAEAFDAIFPVLIDEALVDASSYCADHDVDTLLTRTRADILRLAGCPVSIGAAENVLLARLATRRAKPEGQLYVSGDSDTIDAFLSDVHVRDLPGIGRGISAKLAEETRLDASAICVRDIRPYLAEKLARLLGDATGHKLYNFCRGVDPTPVRLDISSTERLLGRKSVSVEVNFGIRFDTVEQVETFLMAVARELHVRMVRLGVCGTHLTLKLARRRPGTPVNPPKYLGMGLVDFVSRSASLGIPTSDWGIIGSEMKAICRILSIPPQELRGVGVTMTRLVDAAAAGRKQQQLRLGGERLPRTAVPPPPINMPAAPLSSQNYPFAERVVNSESIDWDVFNALPPTIRREFQKELLRRGIPVSSKTRSPPKPAGKLYRQQLFPTQNHGEYRTVTVVESPRKRRRRDSPQKPYLSPLKGRRAPDAAPVYDTTLEYDEDVLHELPPSIQHEVVAECERQQRNRQLTYVSVRKRLERADQRRRELEAACIDAPWLHAQPRLVQPMTVDVFAAEPRAIAHQIARWIALSLPEKGPHPEDVDLFERYVRETAGQGGVVRAVGAVRTMRKRIDVEATKMRICGSGPFWDALEEWRRVLARMMAATEDACGCSVDFE